MRFEPYDPATIPADGVTLFEIEQEVGEWAVLSTVAWYYRSAGVDDKQEWIRHWRKKSMNDNVGELIARQARFRARLRKP